MVPGDVVKLFLGHEVYANMAPSEIRDRVYIPNATGHLVTESGLVFSWVRPSDMAVLQKCMDGDALTVEDFQSSSVDDPLWIVDMAATANWTGLRVGRALGRLLVEHEIAKNGEMCIYRRNGGATPFRYGKAIVRG